jgi:hypothetical protein
MADFAACIAPLLQKRQLQPEPYASFAVPAADLIVSGDQDLLVLKVFEGIPVVTAA